MKIIKNLLEPVANEVEAANLITKLIGAKISKTTIKREIEEHPDYPSLLSISDFFTRHEIDNIVLKINANQLTDTIEPFIVQTYGNNGTSFFSVVKEIKNDIVNYFDPEKSEWILTEKDQFVKKNTGIVLLVGKGDEILEKGYEDKIKFERQNRILKYTRLSCIPILLVALGIFYFLENGSGVLFPFLFLLLTIIGCGIGILLIWYEVDKHNPALNQICTAGKMINCGSILQSGASRIAGLSWSKIGLSYFTGLMILLVFSGLDNKNMLFVISWISILIMPYLVFSIYYQWMVAKQWCVLCLSAMGVLASQAIVSIFAGWHSMANINSITGVQLIQILLAVIFPLLLINVLVPALQEAKLGRENIIQVQKLKHDPNVFNALLKKHNEVSEIPAHLGISIGNPSAKYRIIKICNPYCGPCAEAHKQLEVLMDSNKDFRLQILFTATNDKNDIKTPPVKHFLALADKYGEQTLKRALDDWYLDDRKNYDAFALKHPLSEELKQQDQKIEMMKNWCDSNKIEYTPTFFISLNESEDNCSSTYFKVPRTYMAKDLKDIFTK